MILRVCGNLYVNKLWILFILKPHNIYILSNSISSKYVSKALHSPPLGGALPPLEKIMPPLGEAKGGHMPPLETKFCQKNMPLRYKN